ncbi:MAG: ECF-type sigma factor [Phycisphaerales bacterium]
MSADDVTLLLNALRTGKPDAPGRLIEAVYDELRQMADAKMRRERAGHTLQPTALVNEAFLRLVGNQEGLEDRAHFFGAAAKAMERVLVDHARQKQALKRGGGARGVTFLDVSAEAPDPNLDVLDVHEAIAALDRESPDLASLARYRYFVGLSLEQVAEIEGVSLATIKRRWTFARAWLYDRLAG